MKKLIKNYFTSACITFTLSMLGTTILNLINGFPYQSNGWILVLFGFIMVIELIDYGLSYIDFRSYRAYFIVELILTYALMLAAGYLGHWFSFTIGNILIISAMYLIIYCCIHGYFYKMRRYEADEINALLNNQ